MQVKSVLILQQNWENDVTEQSGLYPTTPPPPPTLGKRRGNKSHESNKNTYKASQYGRKFLPLLGQIVTIKFARVELFWEI